MIVGQNRHTARAVGIWTSVGLTAGLLNSITQNGTSFLKVTLFLTTFLGYLVHILTLNLPVPHPIHTILRLFNANCRSARIMYMETKVAPPPF